MPDFILHLRRLDRSQRREEVEGRLSRALSALDDQPSVAKLTAALGEDSLQVTHYTFDEPLIGLSSAELQFTYHLCARSQQSSHQDHDEIRGSGIAIFDDDGLVRLVDVDAEPYHVPTEADYLEPDEP
jgi:hypothetical protein